MKPKKIWANLGVEDVERTTKFYTTLGFAPNGASKKLVSFRFGNDDFVINFFLKETLLSNVKGRLADPKDGNEVIFTLSAESRNEVDNCVKEVEDAGGKIVSGPEDLGETYYACVFTDPDEHKFNVFYMEGI